MIHCIGWHKYRSTLGEAADAATSEGYLSYALSDYRWLTEQPWSPATRDTSLVGDVVLERSVVVQSHSGAGWRRACYEPQHQAAISLRWDVSRTFQSPARAAAWLQDHAQYHPDDDHVTDVAGDPLPNGKIGLAWLIMDDDATTGLTDNARFCWSHGAIITHPQPPTVLGKKITLHYLAQIPRLDVGPWIAVARGEAGKLLFTTSGDVVTFTLD
jgi:hypothetical protein